MKFIEALKKEDERRALYVTLVFIMLLLMFFLLVSMEQPNPPLEEKIIEIEMDFGSDYEGGGQLSETVTQVKPEPKQESAEEIETQEESPVEVTTGKGTSKTSTNTSKPDPVQEKPKVDESFSLGGSGTSGQGSGSGDKFGSGDGTGGGGKGNEPGSGTSNPSRKLVSKGSVAGNSQEEGKIALDLYVDEFGKVVRTKFNASKSTTGSAYLKDLAEKNAKTYRYQAIPGAPTQPVGTVVFSFTKK